MKLLIETTIGEWAQRNVDHSSEDAFSEWRDAVGFIASELVAHGYEEYRSTNGTAIYIRPINPMRENGNTSWRELAKIEIEVLEAEKFETISDSILITNK